MKKLQVMCMLLFVALGCFSTSTVMALEVELVVEHNAGPGKFRSIQNAIDHATSLLSSPSNTLTFRVVVEPSATPYSGSTTLFSNVPVEGRETARTIVTAGTGGTAFIASNVSNVTIKNLTIRDAQVGILISNSSTVKLANNIFRTGSQSTSVQVQTSGNITIINNVFYQNGTAVSRDADIVVTNNIFLDNVTAIANTNNVAAQSVTYNDYYLNDNNGVDLDANSIPNTSITNGNPLFADPANNDFHLQATSPCINNGNLSYRDIFDDSTSDIGAYGGPDADTIPFPVSGLSSPSGTSNSLSLSWTANKSYLVNGYRVYYGTSSGNYNGTGAAEGDSPLIIKPAGNTTATLTNLVSTVTSTPSAPVLIALTPLSNALKVEWAASTGATGYNIYYSTAPFTNQTKPSTFVSLPGSVTSATIKGLVNLQPYHVAVSAKAQTTYSIAVTSFNKEAGSFSPGIDNESAYTEIQRPVGESKESDISGVVEGYPEAIQGFPNLPNEGCFIATAAYGYYSAPQVQVLRNFRDRYLMTHRTGRAFVEWYYRWGPAGAAFLSAHPWLKPVVRAALLPLLSAAFFMTSTPGPVMATGIFIVLMVLLFLLKRKLPSVRGIQ